jgi:hypothetical protein
VIFFKRPSNEGGQPVRSVEILRKQIDRELSFMHRGRQDAVWRAVEGLIVGGKACLTALGRSLPGATSEKHKIKAVDRLLGNEALHLELNRIYKVLARWLLKSVRTPVIAVDWTGAGAHHYELSAKICSDGRALPLYSQVYAKKKYAQTDSHNAFLRELSKILPSECKPILVTDAGFYHAWFAEVQHYGWHYIGRVRGSAHVLLGSPFAGQVLTLKELHCLAGTQAKDFGSAIVSSGTRRLVLSPRPRRKGRKRLTRNGKPGRKTVDKTCSKGAREPWVLVTSLQVDAASVVYGYSLRMQIEESFRDHKSTRNGWSMRLTVTRSAERMSVMLLIASLADMVVQIAGRAHAVSEHASGLQANTMRKQRVLSFFFRGCSACSKRIELTTSQLRAAIKEITASVVDNAAHFLGELSGAFVRARSCALRRRLGAT